jgi:hypothetical protein
VTVSLPSFRPPFLMVNLLFVKLPHGCPLSSVRSYWKLKSLFTASIGPHVLFSNFLQSPEIGLHPTKHDPCIFHGTIIPGNSPLYVAYVDDFILAWRMRLNITLRPPYPRSLLSIFWVRQSNFLAGNSIGQITLMVMFHVASPRRGMQLLLWRRWAYLQLTNHPR